MSLASYLCPAIAWWRAFQKHLIAPIKEASSLGWQCRASQMPLNLCLHLNPLPSPRSASIASLAWLRSEKPTGVFQGSDIGRLTLQVALPNNVNNFLKYIFCPHMYFLSWYICQIFCLVLKVGHWTKLVRVTLLLMQHSVLLSTFYNKYLLGRRSFMLYIFILKFLVTFVENQLIRYVHIATKYLFYSHIWLITTAL